VSRRLVLLHTADIHGRVEALARIATVVERIRADSSDGVIWIDAGDVEDQTNRLSNVTKGIAMLRLLQAAGCEAVAVGNASIIRYGPQVLADHAAAVTMPLICANLRSADGSLLPGAVAATTLDVRGTRLGLVGVTATTWASGEPLYDVFGTTEVDPADEVQSRAAELRAGGADVVVLVSHLGLEGDRVLASQLDGDVDAILGGHSHDRLQHGEVVGRTLLSHTGEFGSALARVELGAGGASVRVVPVDDDVPGHPAVVAEAQRIEREVEGFLDEVVGALAAPLDWAADRECGTGAFMADVLRMRMGADVGISAAGSAFTRALPAGSLRRGVLWDACPGAGNPGIATMTGRRLREAVMRGLDPAVAAETPRPLRGMPNGLVHLSGAEVRDGRLFVAGSVLAEDDVVRVAGTDWELEAYGPYADAAWQLEVAYDVPTIQREAVEEHLARHGRVEPPEPRLHGPLR
jgi:5'-nucleotidase